MKLDVFSLIVLLGALQALFFGIYLLFTRSHNKLQKRSLAIFILILSYNGFETLNWSSGLRSRWNPSNAAAIAGNAEMKVSSVS